LALPPDSGDSFIREVDENLKRDQARDFAKKNLPWIVVALVLFLAAIGGYLYWQHRQEKAAAEKSEALAQIFRDVGTPGQATVPPRLEQVASNSDDAIRATARFAKAAVALESNDRAGAIAEYGKIASDDDLADEYRNLATIRRTELEFDTIKPEEVIARLQPFNKAGNPWFGKAGELTAMAYLKQGKKAEAGRLFAAIAADRQVPETIRSRAVQIAGTLGVDASASMPTVVTQPQVTQ
jgi:hypothetical protein